jgi:hypothetical protein
VGPFAIYKPLPSATSDEAFVEGLYLATLLRPGNPAEVQFYVNLLGNGTLTREQAAQNFYNSPENRGNQVKFFYRYFLGRVAVLAEVDFYVEYLRSGGDEGRVMQNFILSPEYAGQNTDVDFVNTMYYSMLGRTAAPAEVEFYTNALANLRASREQVVLNFLRSPESIDRVVRSDYVAYLKREPGAGELGGWRAHVQNGASFGSVAIAMLGSQEFYDRADDTL